MNNIEKVFDEFIKEAENGCVDIDGKKANIHFHTSNDESSFNDLSPVLVIKDKKRLLGRIEKYLECIQSKNIKFSLVFLFINATYEDFSNFENYLNRRIDFLKNPLFKNRTIDDIKSFDSEIEIKIGNCGQETPYTFNTIIKNGLDHYDLPVISYGISNDICYIYAIQDMNSERTSPYQKKIKRKLYGLNNGVIQTDEYKKFKNNEDDYYPENINDVSPSAILALTIFLNELRMHNIRKVKVVPFLPIRYYAKEEAFIKMVSYKSKKEMWNKEKISHISKEFMDELLRIQNNLTQKLIRNFKRLEFHFDNIRIVSYPYDLEENMSVEIGEFKNTNNPILKEIIEKKGDLDGEISKYCGK